MDFCPGLWQQNGGDENKHPTETDLLVSVLTRPYHRWSVKRMGRGDIPLHLEWQSPQSRTQSLTVAKTKWWDGLTEPPRLLSSNTDKTTHALAYSRTCGKMENRGAVTGRQTSTEFTKQNNIHSQWVRFSVHIWSALVKQPNIQQVILFILTRPLHDLAFKPAVKDREFIQWEETRITALCLLVDNREFMKKRCGLVWQDFLGYLQLWHYFDKNITGLLPRNAWHKCPSGSVM